AANTSMSAIHHRMPVTLAAQDWSLWLGESGKGAAALMHAAPKNALKFHRVDPQVNSNKAHGPGLIQAL
ncbi:MAG: SOS response-associated peptidase, partial [Boseongicola sp.]|nr:SOS response-associated peptidase [Boseongicola sp.]